MHIIRAAPTQRRKLNCKKQCFFLSFYLLCSFSPHHPFQPLFSAACKLRIRQKPPQIPAHQDYVLDLCFSSTYRCLSSSSLLNSCWSCELNLLHLQGVNSRILPCQQTLGNPHKAFQWPWILFKFRSSSLAKITQLSKI